MRDPLAARALHDALDGRLTTELADALPPPLRLLAAAAALDADEFERAEALLDGSAERAQPILAKWMRAELALRSGRRVEAALDALIETDAPWLADAARLQRAQFALAKGESAAPWLSEVRQPDFRSRAAHLLALESLAQDAAAGSEALRQLFEADPAYAGRHDVAMQLASHFLDAGDPATALEWYEAAASQWQTRHDLLAQTDAIDLRSSAHLTLDPAATDAALAELLRQAQNHGRELPERTPEIDLAAPRLPPTPILRVSAAHADSLADMQVASDIALWRARLAEQRAREEDEALQRRRNFLEHGRQTASGLRDELGTAQARLAAISSQLAQIRAKLDRVHELELRRIAQRTQSLIKLAERNARAITMLRDVYVEGPMARYDQRLDAKTPQPRDLLLRETALAGGIADFSTQFAREVPELLARSMRERLAPRILDAAPRLEALALQLAADQERFVAQLGAAYDAAFSSPTLDFWMEVAAQALVEHQDLLVRQVRLGDRAKAAAREQALADLAREREGIDYGLATATYERSLELAEAGDEDSAEAVQLRQSGVERLQLALGGYPEAPWRAEARFRLADLLLADARGDFHRRMQQYLATREGTVPVLDHEPALQLYRQILAEDLDWAHRDAARYALGMLLADQEDAQAMVELQQLLRDHPDSQHRQRAELRVADLYFAQEEFLAAGEHYEAAAAGADPEIVAIALYKLGWCHLNREEDGAAALAFTRLLDLYEAGFTTSQSVDLRQEAEDDLVKALARSGGARGFAAHFDAIGEREYAPAILASLSNMLRRYALYPDAIASDELYLARYPLRAQSLDAGERLLDSHRRHSQDEAQRGAQLALAERFRPDGAWAAAQSDSSALARAQTFAKSGYREAALEAHRAAKAGAAEAYPTARAHYETLLALWPSDAEAPRFSLLAGQCALEQNDYAIALDHFTAAAASDTASFRVDAAWQRVYTADRWYESSRNSATAVGEDRLAKQLVTIGGEYLQAHGQDARALDLRWRLANLQFAHAQFDAAERSLADFANSHPQDARVWQAHRLRGEALQKLSRFDQAALAYQSAIAAAPADASGREELARLIPHCYFKHAEAVAASDQRAEAAPLFAALADGFPQFEHAPLARYQSGLLHAEAKQNTLAVAQWESLIAQHPQHELSVDAHRRIAAAWQAEERWADASRAFERYSETYPKESDSADALLLAVDMAQKAGDTQASRRLQDRYLERFPDDTEMAFLVREERAQAALSGLGGASISSLLGSTQAPSDLKQFLDLAAARPEQASPALLARIRFLQAEEKRSGYEQIALGQPLEQSLLRKKDALEALIAAYGEAAELAASPWAQASAFRIGEALAHFGDALAAAPAPSELDGDDLAAYRDVLEQQSWSFLDRAEAAWTQLLRDGDAAAPESAEWFEHTRRGLYPRIARRFVHRIEVEVPLIPAQAPAGVLSR